MSTPLQNGRLRRQITPKAIVVEERYGGRDETGEFPMPTPSAVAVARARLLMLTGESPGRSVPVDGTLVMGRGGDADLQIDHHGVSRHHARITIGPDGRFVIEDLRSRNGTLVNGRRIVRETLSFGDRIQLGAETVLLFTFIDPAEEQIAHQDRMESVSHLAAGVAHDFNNLLAVVMASLDELAALPAGAPLDAEHTEAVRDAREAAAEATDLARHLLDFSRPRQTTFQLFELGAVVAEAAQLSRRALPESVRLVADTSAQLTVHADPEQVRRAVVNLCLNARDAMPEGGTLRITVTPVSVLTSPERQAMIVVQDTGCGMDETTRRRCFEPFFTTKRRGQGSGLGLASVYATVRNHGGRIEVESHPGKGTTFRIYLGLVASERLRATGG